MPIKMKNNISVLMLTTLALFGFIEGGVLRYKNEGGKAVDGSALWIANFFKTTKIWFKGKKGI